MTRPLPATLLALALCAAGAGARAEEGDIRDLTVGMAAAELPQVGYVELVCAGKPDTALGSWADYETCASDKDGRREVRFQFDDSTNPRAQYNDNFRGTRVGGHPVLISLRFTARGIVDAILIETDPKVRLFLKKKAFLMALQIRERYGAEGWTCADRPKAAGEEALAGQFIKEHCEKATATRRYAYDRDLYQKSGQDLRDFVSTTRFAILAKE